MLPTTPTEAFRLLCQPGLAYEIRAFGVPRWSGYKVKAVSGYFDDIEKMGQEAADLTSQGAECVYFTPNPCHKDLLARCYNTTEPAQTGMSTSDVNILRRHWLLVDVDPVRPRGISSTNEQLAAAGTTAKAIFEQLTGLGWPEPIVGISGNGAHLMWRVDEPNDDATRDLFSNFLARLVETYSSETISIDKTVFNAARVWKVPGTWARKGSNMPDRPHRLAQIRHVPAELVTLSREQIEAFAAPPQAAPRHTPEPSFGRFDLGAFVAQHFPDAQADAYNGGRKWVLEVCPFNSDHNDRSAVIIERPDGAIGFRCHHNGCSGRDWRELRELLEPGGYQKPVFDDRDVDAFVAGEAGPESWSDRVKAIPITTPHAELFPQLRAIMAEVAQLQPLERDAFVALVCSRFELGKRAVQSELKTARRIRVEAFRDDWRAALKWTEARDGEEPKCIPCSANIITILGNHPAWRGVLAYDEFADQTVALKPPPWDPLECATPEAGPWQNTWDTWLDAWLQRCEFGLHFKRQLTPIVDAVAQRNRVHPVREYLSELAWDGTPRDLSKYLGTDSPLAPLACRWMLIAAVARVFQPGCKVDYMTILQGEQGKLKSSAIKALFGSEWFADTYIDLNSKDAMLALRGKWCIEWQEFDAFSRYEQGRIKAFVSSPSDHYRKPYERRESDNPRQCVFFATTNHREVLQDETGGRRFWPFWCDELDLGGIERDRDQLWAQAVAEYHHGAAWWPVTPEERAICGEAQEDARKADAWQGIISRWLRTYTRDRVTMADIAYGALGIEASKLGKPEQTRIGAAMKSIGGWRARRAMIEGVRERFFEREHVFVVEDDEPMWQ